MKRYIKTSIVNSDINSIRRNLFLYYGLLKNEYNKFLQDFDDIIYQEIIEEEFMPELREDFHKKYAPLYRKCKEIIADIRKDVTGHVIDQTIRYEMYDMAKSILFTYSSELDKLNAVYR